MDPVQLGFLFLLPIQLLVCDDTKLVLNDRLHPWQTHTYPEDCHLHSRIDPHAPHTVKNATASVSFAGPERRLDLTFGLGARSDRGKQQVSTKK